MRSWGSFFDAQDDPELTASQPGQFYGPRDIAIHDGEGHVTDTGNERGRRVFTLEGEFVGCSPASSAPTSGQLIEPVGIAVADDGTVFVADSHNARLSRFSSEGEPLDPWPVEAWAGQQFFEPYVTAGPDGRIFASDPAGGQIIVFDATGQQLDPIDDPSLLRPYDMAITSDGLQMLITDGLTNSVIRLSLSPVG
ncbi:MAG: NHL repeat-containing protein [Thermomicrobiales bacterium]